MWHNGGKISPIDPCIFCIGDSLTQGDTGRDSEATMHLTDYNYPYYLAKRLNKTVGTEVINMGACGQTSASWYSNCFTDERKNLISSNKNCVVCIMFGANGGLNTPSEVDSATSDTDSSVGKYMKLIEDIYDLTDGLAQIILLGTTYVDPDRNANYVTNVTQSQETTEAIAKKYNLPFFSCYNELGINSINTTELQPRDGLHLGEDGYSRLGTFVASKILSVASWAYE